MILIAGELTKHLWALYYLGGNPILTTIEKLETKITQRVIDARLKTNETNIAHNAIQK